MKKQKKQEKKEKTRRNRDIYLSNISLSVYVAISPSVTVLFLVSSILGEGVSWRRCCCCCLVTHPGIRPQQQSARWKRRQKQ